MILNLILFSVFLGLIVISIIGLEKKIEFKSKLFFIVYVLGIITWALGIFFALKSPEGFVYRYGEAPYIFIQTLYLGISTALLSQFLFFKTYKNGKKLKKREYIFPLILFIISFFIILKKDTLFSTIEISSNYLKVKKEPLIHFWSFYVLFFYFLNLYVLIKKIKLSKNLIHKRQFQILFLSYFICTTIVIFTNLFLSTYFNIPQLNGLGPSFYMIEVGFFIYATKHLRFFDLRLTFQNYLASLSNTLIYLFPLIIFTKLFQTGEITQRVLIGHFFVLLTLALFFWEKTLPKCDIFWNYVLYRKKENPIEEIKQSLSKFQESFSTGVNSLAIALGIKKLQFVFIKEKKAKNYQPIFDFFEKNPGRELIKEEIDYTIESINSSKELKKIQKNMQKHSVSATIPVLDNKKKLIGILILEQKINGKLFSVQEIKETKKLLGNALVYLSKSKKKGKEKVNKKIIEKDFINGLMHEIRHPLVIASNLKDMIDWEKLNTDDQKFLSTSQEDLYLLSQNLDKISEAVHWQHQSILTEKSFGTFQSLFDSLLTQKFEGKITLKIDPQIAQKMFEFDFHNLKIAFQEIIKNAFFFNKKDKKKLEIEVTKINEKIILNFTDNGNGIDKNSWEKVFDLLFVEAFSRNPAECGLGVGLTIAKGIILAHNGDIKILKSKKEEGTTFSVSLKIDLLDS